MQRKRRRPISAGPWLDPKEYPRRCMGYGRAACSFPAFRCRNILPSLWEECLFVRSSRTGNNEIIIATDRNAVNAANWHLWYRRSLRRSLGEARRLRRKKINPFRQSEPNRENKITQFRQATPNRDTQNQYQGTYSHVMSASTRREMTLDYSFLSDSRNFCL